MNDKKLKSYIVSSQTKVFFDSEIKENDTSASVLANEPFSFVLAYKAEAEECIPISVTATCAGVEICVYKIENVPVIHAKRNCEEVGSEGRGAGMYPDMLLGRRAEPEITESKDMQLPFYEKNEKNLLNATCDSFQSVLICVNENGKAIPRGKYEIKICIKSLLDGSVLGTHIFHLKVIGKCLPKQTIMYTNWFHYDCLADIHGVELYSDKYFELLGKYLENASRHGMNTLLLPAFTPALDTCIGEERQNVQLVKIKKCDGGYEFDFSLLEQFIELAGKSGIEYFEHVHLFSQWGAEHAPNIYAEVEGVCKRIFGWETDASREEYKDFLKSYFEGLMKIIKRLGIADNMFFHVSDEPTDKNKESYEKAANIAASFLKEFKSGDALSSFKFYENGLVKTPIVSIADAENFFGKCESLWLYYTGGGGALGKCSNRLITDKPYRTRILGLHLYKYKAKGFLHWGYNYYYDRMSKGIFDPKTNPCGYKQIPGASYLVYPGNGEPVSSLREKYMCEAMCDFKTLKLLEEYVGYERVIEICETFFGKRIDAFTMPENEAQMLKFRQRINEEIEKFGE